MPARPSRVPPVTSTPVTLLVACTLSLLAAPAAAASAFLPAFPVVGNATVSSLGLHVRATPGSGDDVPATVFYAFAPVMDATQQYQKPTAADLKAAAGAGASTIQSAGVSVALDAAGSFPLAVTDNGDAVYGANDAIAGLSASTTYTVMVVMEAGDGTFSTVALLNANTLGAECLANSYAPTAELALRARVEAGDILNTPSGAAGDVQAATNIKAVYEVMVDADQGHNLMLYVGLHNGEFYGVLRCFTAEQAGNMLCRQAGAEVEYLGYVLRTDETQRKVYVLGADGSVADWATPLGVTGAYNSTLRPWFTHDGWTDEPYGFASSDLMGISYSKAVTSVDGHTWAIGADRGYGAGASEPCWNSCRANSYAIPAATALAASINTGAVTMAAATDQAGITANVKTIFRALVAPENDYGSSMFVYADLGSSSDFYGVVDCYVPENGPIPFCKKAAVKGVQYLAFVRSSAVLGDTHRHVFMMDSAGAVSSFASSWDAGDYSAASRARYNSEGWTAPYASLPSTYSADASAHVITYVVHAGAVRVGADRNSQVTSTGPSSEPCYSSCRRNSYASSTTRIVAATASVQGYDPASPPSTIEDIGALAKTAADALLTTRSDTGSSAALYWGYTDSNFVLVKDCYVRENSASDAFCRQASLAGHRMVVYVRASSYFTTDPTVRRVFFLDEANSLVEGAPLMATSYDPLTRSWYKMVADSGGASGFTPPFALASTGQVAVAYATPIWDATGATLVGVAAATRFLGSDSSEPCRNSCLKYSYAPHVTRITAATPEIFNRTTVMSSLDDIAAAAKATAQALLNRSSDTGSSSAVYWGREDTGDHMTVKDCHVPENVGSLAGGDNYCRKGGYRFVAYVRATAVFLGDEPQNRRVWYMNDAMEIVNREAPILASLYDPRVRGWYKMVKDSGGAAGWTAPFVLASTGQLATAYASPMFDHTGTTLVGVVGATRFIGADSSEPCHDSCRFNSYAPKAARILARADGIATYEAASTPLATVDDVEAMAATVAQALLSNRADTGSAGALYVGFEGANADFVNVKDCYVPEQARGDNFCKSWGTRLVVYARAVTLFAGSTEPTFRRVWAMDDGFGLVNPDSPSIESDYDPHVRGWYRAVKDSAGTAQWVDPFALASTGQIAVAFAHPVFAPDATTLVGVVGATRFLGADSSEPCYDSCAKNQFAYRAAWRARTAFIPHLASFKNAATRADLDAAALAIYDTWSTSASTDFDNAVAFGNIDGNYIGTWNCVLRPTDDECKQAGPGTNVVIEVRHNGVFGDNLFHIARVTAAGGLEFFWDADVWGDYDAVQRPWFANGRDNGVGWSPLFTTFGSDWPSSDLDIAMYDDAGEFEGVITAVKGPPECGPTCNRNSFAVRGALNTRNTMIGLMSAWDAATTEADLLAIGAQVYATWYAASDSPFSDAVAFGDSNGDYVGTWNCRLRGCPLNWQAGADSDAIVDLVHRGVFLDDITRHYRVLRDGSLQYIESSFEYDASVRPWYLAAATGARPIGYTDPFASADASGGTYGTFNAAIHDPADLSRVWGVATGIVTPGLDTCTSGCDSNAESRHFSHAFATLASNFLAAIMAPTDLSDVAPFMQHMLAAYQREQESETSRGAGIGTKNGDYFAIVNCRQRPEYGPCAAAGSAAAYLFDIRSPGVHSGDEHRHYYRVTPDGTLDQSATGEVTTSSSTYDATTRPWYAQARDSVGGFSAPFKSASTNAVYVSYSTRIFDAQGALAGVSTGLGSLGMGPKLLGCRSGCRQYSFAKRAADTLVQQARWPANYDVLSSASTAADVGKISALLARVFNSQNQGRQAWLSFVAADGASYTLFNCHVDSDYAPCNSITDRRTTFMVLGVGNERLYSDARRRWFAVPDLATGALGASLGTDSHDFAAEQTAYVRAKAGWAGVQGLGANDEAAGTAFYATFSTQLLVEPAGSPSKGTCVGAAVVDPEAHDGERLQASPLEPVSGGAAHVEGICRDVCLHGSWALTGANAAAAALQGSSLAVAGSAGASTGVLNDLQMVLASADSAAGAAADARPRPLVMWTGASGEAVVVVNCADAPAFDACSTGEARVGAVVARNTAPVFYAVGADGSLGDAALYTSASAMDTLATPAYTQRTGFSFGPALTNTSAGAVWAYYSTAVYDESGDTLMGVASGATPPVAMCAAGIETAADGTLPPGQQKAPDGLSDGAKAGIAILVVIGVFSLGGLFYVFVYKPQADEKKKLAERIRQQAGGKGAGGPGRGSMSGPISASSGVTTVNPMDVAQAGGGRRASHSRRAHDAAVPSGKDVELGTATTTTAAPRRANAAREPGKRRSSLTQVSTDDA